MNAWTVWSPDQIEGVDTFVPMSATESWADGRYTATGTSTSKATITTGSSATLHGSLGLLVTPDMVGKYPVVRWYGTATDSPTATVRSRAHYRELAGNAQIMAEWSGSANYTVDGTSAYTEHFNAPIPENCYFVELRLFRQTENSAGSVTSVGGYAVGFTDTYGVTPDDPAPPSSGSEAKVWNGTAWRDDAKVWTGTAWQPLSVWQGSRWTGVGSGEPAPVIADDFNRADTNGASWGNTPIGDAAWTTSSWDTWRIKSNAAQPQATGQVSYVWVHTQRTSYRLECDIEMNRGLYIIGALLFRSNGTTSANNWGQLMFSNGHSTVANGLTLYNGSAGELGVYPYTFNDGDNHHLAVEVTETTIKAFLNDVEVLSATDSTNSTFPMVGLRCIAQYDAVSRYDNFEVYDL
jgi:hypothetical protein